MLLCGCSGFNNVTGSELYVQSVGIDMKDGLYTCTLQIFDPTSGAATLQEQKDSITKVLTVSDTSVSSALAQIPDKLGKRVFYSQNKAIVLGRSVLEDPLRALDYFIRDWESGLNTRLMIAQGDASDIISATFGGSINPSEQLRLAVDSGEKGGNSVGCTLLDVVKASEDDRLGLCIPIMELQNKGESNESLQCSSAGLFVSLKPAGVLSSEQSQTMLMLLNKSDTIEMSLPDQPDMSVELTSVRTDVSVSVESDKSGKRMVCSFDVKVKGGVSQIGDYSYDLESMEQIVCSELYKRVQETVEQTVVNSGCDMFKIASRLSYCDRGLFNAVKSDWQNNIKNVKFQYNIDADITRTGDKKLDTEAV